MFAQNALGARCVDFLVSRVRARVHSRTASRSTGNATTLIHRNYMTRSLSHTLSGGSSSPRSSSSANIRYRYSSSTSICGGVVNGQRIQATGQPRQPHRIRPNGGDNGLLSRSTSHRFHQMSTRTFATSSTTSSPKPLSSAVLGLKRSSTRLRKQPAKRPLAVIELREGESQDELLKRFAKGKQTSVPLNSLLIFGSSPTDKKLLRASIFLHRELPVRLAKRAVELGNLPHGLSDMAAVRVVRSWYVTSFLDLVHMPEPASIADELKFTALLKDIYERHSSILGTMASGVHAFKQKALKEMEANALEAQRSDDAKSNGSVGVDGSKRDDVMRVVGGDEITHSKRNSEEKSSDDEDELCPFDLEQMFPEVQQFLDKFFLSRVGIRVLIGQHIALHEGIEGWVGLICEHTSPSHIARNAIDHARHICRNTYGRAPNVIVSGPHLDHTFPYVPAFLHHMLFELLKNSMRAVIEHHGADARHLPDIRVIIADGESNDDVCIKISDEGGGIERRNMDAIWSYMYTTAPAPDTPEMMTRVSPGQTSEEIQALFNDNLRPQTARNYDYGDDAPMAGLGYGLSISRLFARYFGGDIDIKSLEGLGTDAYIHMRCLGDSKEPLP